MIDFRFSKLWRACASKVSGILPLGPRAPCPETYRNSPAKMPGLYGPIGLALGGNITRFSAPAAKTAEANRSRLNVGPILTWQVYPARAHWRIRAKCGVISICRRPLAYARGSAA